MKQKVIYNQHTITVQTDGHCALIFKGTDLTNEQLNGTDLLVKCIAGSSLEHAIEKAMQWINEPIAEQSKVTFDTTKLSQFMQATSRKDLTAYREEILKFVNSIGTVINKGFKVVGVKYGRTTVNIPYEYLITL